MSWKISSSFAAGTAGRSDNGSPMCCWTRVVAAEDIGRARSSICQHLAVALHHLFDQMSAPHNAFAFGNEVILGHVEEIEIGRAAIELHPGAVRVLDEVVDRFRRSRLDRKLFGDALLHPLAGGGGADDLDLVIHGGGDGGLEKGRPQFLAVARVGVDHDDDELLGHPSLGRGVPSAATGPGTSLY